MATVARPTLAEFEEMDEDDAFAYLQAAGKLRAGEREHLEAVAERLAVSFSNAIARSPSVRLG